VGFGYCLVHRFDFPAGCTGFGCSAARSSTVSLLVNSFAGSFVVVGLGVYLSKVPAARNIFSSFRLITPPFHFFGSAFEVSAAISS